MKKQIIYSMMAATIFSLTIAPMSKSVEKDIVKNYVSQIQRTADGMVKSYSILMPKVENPISDQDYKEVTVDRVDNKFYQKGKIHIKTKFKLDNGKEDFLQSASNLQPIFNQLGVREIKAFASVKELENNPEMIQSGFDRLYEISIPIDADPVNVCAELMTNPDVEYACPIYIRYSYFKPNDTQLNQQYALANMKLFEAWDETKGSSEVTIAIIDSGTDWKHGDLAANIWTNPKEIDGNGIDDDGNGKIDDIRGWDLCATKNVSEFNSGVFGEDNDPVNLTNTHGSSVAGCASAATNNNKGVAGAGFNCKLIPVKVGSEISGADGIYGGYAGITYAANVGAKIINCSWGGSGYSAAEEQIVNYAVNKKGCVLIVAAGNEYSNNDNFPSYPCNYPGVFSVGATDAAKKKTDFSNYGYSVHSFAPGSKIYTTDASNQYTTIDGTSFSSPYVAGVAGLILSVNPTWTPQKVYHQLRSTSDRNIYIDNQKVDQLYGSINAYKAVTLNRGTNSTVPGVGVIGFTIDGNLSSLKDFNSRKFNTVVKNYLGKAKNLKITPYSPDSYLICGDAITLDTLGTDEQKLINLDIRLSEQCPWFEGYAMLVLRYEADGYSDYEMIKIPVNLPSSNQYTYYTSTKPLMEWTSVSAPTNNLCWALGRGGTFGQYSGYLKLYNNTINASLFVDNTANQYISNQVTALVGTSNTNAIAGVSGENQAQIIRTVDGGSRWIPLSVSSMTDFINDIHFFASDAGVMLGDPKNGKWGVAVTSNNGGSWKSINLPAPLVGESGTTGASAIFNSSAWFGTSKGRIYTSNSKGNTWAVFPGLGGQILYLTFQSDKEGMAIYQLNSGKRAIAITKDAGETWIVKNQDISNLNFDPVNVFSVPLAKAYYIVNSDGSIFKSANECGSWTPELSSRDNASARAGAYNNGTNTVTLFDVGPNLGKLVIKYQAFDAKPEITFPNGTVFVVDTTVVHESKLKSLKISNKGNANAMISKIAFEPMDNTYPGEFAVVSTAPTNLEPLAEANLSIKFTPATYGLKQAKLVITYNGTPTTSSVLLKGYGKENNPTTILTFTGSDKLEFGTVKVNNSKKISTSLKNTGNQNIELTEVDELAGANTDMDEFKVTYGSPLSDPITPGTTWPIDVEFNPLTIGNKSATVTIAYKGATAPLVLTLNGIGSDGNTKAESSRISGTTKVHPNPAKDYIELTTDENFADVNSIEIYNNNGELILSAISSDKFSKNLIINTSSIASGFYKLVINRNGTSETMSIIIVK